NLGTRATPRCWVLPHWRDWGFRLIPSHGSCVGQAFWHYSSTDRIRVILGGTLHHKIDEIIRIDGPHSYVLLRFLLIPPAADFWISSSTDSLVGISAARPAIVLVGLFTIDSSGDISTFPFFGSLVR